MMDINILVCIVINIVKTPPTIFLNLFIILTSDHRKMRTTTTTGCLLANLVIADLLMGCFASPFAAAEFLMIYLGKDPCFLSNFTTPVSLIIGVVSVITLAILAIDSYMLFCHPFKHQRLQCQTLIYTVLIAIWALPLYPTLESTFNEDMTTFDAFVVFLSALVFPVYGFCYGNIYKLIRRHKRQIREVTSNHRLSCTENRDKNSVICAAMLLTSTILCLCPVIVLSSLSAVTSRRNKRLIGYLTYWAWTLATLNSLINPIFKFYRLDNVRSAFKKFWKRGRRLSVATAEMD